MDLITKQHFLLNPSVKFVKTHEDAELPKANNSEIGTGDSGYDLTTVEDVLIPGNSSAVIPVGLTLAYIEKGYWFRIDEDTDYSIATYQTPTNQLYSLHEGWNLISYIGDDNVDLDFSLPDLSLIHI